jgi:hypothetical protein
MESVFFLLIGIFSIKYVTVNKRRTTSTLIIILFARLINENMIIN